ncbi:hypothetical protein CHUAL_004823 [Chamberlinius hualienensis]
MFIFDGEFRRKPQQSLGGMNSKVKREDLIQRANQERQKREEFRKQVNSAIKIQGFVRRYLSVIKAKNNERAEFDSLKGPLELAATSKVDFELILEKLLHKFLFFYEKSKDSLRLVWLCQIILKHSAIVVFCLDQRQDRWLFKIIKFQKLCLEYLLMAVAQKQSYALPFRIIEVFLDQNTYLKNNITTAKSHRLVMHSVLYLVKNGYYPCLRSMIDTLIPNTIELKVTASTPVADSLLQLLLKPLSFVGTTTELDFKNFVLREFSRAFLCQPFSSQVQEFILPSLFQNTVDFPFNDFINSLLNCSSEDSCMNIYDLKVQVTPSPYLLYSVLSLASKCHDGLGEKGLWAYLQVLRLVMPSINLQTDSNNEQAVSSDSEDDEYEREERMETNSTIGDSRSIIEISTKIINEPFHVNLLLLGIENRSECNLMALCHVCYSLLMHHRLAINKYRLLYTLAFKPNFFRYLWHSVANMASSPSFGSPTPLLQLLSRGISLSPQERNDIVPVLVIFCSLMGYLFQTLHDSEFYGTVDSNGQETQSPNMPFSLNELTAVSLSLRDLCLGLIELTNPITWPNITDDYTEAVMSIDERRIPTNLGVELEDNSLQQWAHLFKVAVNLVRQLYLRDTRKSFCPKDHWLSKRISIPIPKANNWQLQLRSLRRMRFHSLRRLIPENEEDNLPVSIINVRHGIILQELPFLIPFHDRVKIFQHLVYMDKRDIQREANDFLTGPQVQIQCRRNYIYEDAFDRLSPLNEPNLKLKMRVQLVNFVGLDEAGIDGGGVFREFLHELLLTAINPNRGFFILTLDNLLYPNPNVHLLFDDFSKHYYFIGRILGKAIYENMLVEIPFASFFLSKILGRHSTNVDIDHLCSLDPVLYRNLLSLKQYDGDVTDLGLDFTVVNEEMGETKVAELEPGGSKIPVTESNKIRYIHLMAHYKLNRQIKAQCDAFKQGLFNVVNPEWLQMFDWKELQVLISGAHVPIDIEDLRQHTTYSGVFNVEHSLIHSFWKIVSTFSEKQKRQLLKFVTSCSRPPLLGFKDLYPTFCIQSAGSEERLPTSSTCMNLLKLPVFKDESTLKTKLLYAIEAESGFELS